MKTLVSVLAMYLACVATIARAAEITWNSAVNVSAASDVSTEGVLVEAFNAGGNISGTDQTVNGVLFTGTSSLLTANTDNDVFKGDTGDAAYNALLSSVDYGGGSGLFSQDLGGGNLEIGSNYLIQVWFVDTRFASRVMQFGDGHGNTVDLVSSPGQYAIGAFHTDGDRQALSFDAQGFGNAHITAYQIRLTTSYPIPTLFTVTNLVSAPFTVDVNFTEAVTGLEESDFSVSNGTVTASTLLGSNDTYTVEITPATNGDIAVSLPANSVTATNGDGNPNLVSDTLTVLYISPGSEQPSASLSTASSNVTSSFTVDISFDEPVTGLELDDFVVDNGSISNLSGSGANYTILVLPNAEGNISICLPERVVIDLDGDGLWNRASETLVTAYQILEAPTVTLHGNLASATPGYSLFITCSEEVTGLDASDFVLANGVISGIETNGRFYSATITATSPGSVSVMLPAGVATDIDGDELTNTVSNTLTFQCTSDFGESWIVDEAAEWAAAAATVSNLTLSGGFAEPTTNTAHFTSIVKTFPVKKKARNLLFQQSPVWDDWTGIADVDPVDANDAPVMISIEDGNYYYLGLGSTGGYHAWHSTNMVDWVEKGPVTAPKTGRWVTSAEYKDGAFYIYSDYFNDHTPCLFIDTNLADGVVGDYMGAAFVKDTHGSDCSLIRSNDDGLFHLIYEDWSPINARTHSWDSPLAGHASSADGLTGFEAHEHQYPVDLRTTPTGTFATYDHPNVKNCIYEIHEPEQDSYGDWTSIKIGSRFYMFGDYDPHDTGIKIARFTSDSIYGEYKRVGSLGDGHPDPTICFAEHQFYLITQQDIDYISPGPWVDGVEARAGVDIDGDGTIDQWTAWQPISEQYDHTPEFIRVVTLTPAQLDLSSIPEGYGFQYEFRVDNTVVADVSPIMDRVEMNFEPSNFQQWANTNGIPAEANADHNTNGIPDMMEFSIGQTVVPERQADGSLTVTAVNEAIEDGLEVELWFTDNLLESWSVAATNSEGVKLLSDVADSEGNHNLLFEIFDSNGASVFWKLVVVSLE